MALTHTALQALKPRDKNYAVTERDGLFVEILTFGAMVWRYKYHFSGKREKLTIGRYSEIGLVKARELRDGAARLVALGKSPAEKQASKLWQRVDSACAATFRKLADRWFDENIKLKSENWQYNVRNWLKLDIYPALGELDPRAITEDDLHRLMVKF